MKNPVSESTMRDINEYIGSLIASRISGQIAYHKIIPGNSAVYKELERPWDENIQTVVDALGINGLYQHQAQAIDLIRCRHNVVIATPTASGKTFIYNLPVLEKIIKNPNAKALYLFPLKALAQDQLRAFKEMAEPIKQVKPTAAIYDGDTTSWNRSRIRSNPPNIVMTNPEMLHLSILPYHNKWAAFLSGLEIVVVDEVHTYRGLMGSHMAQIFRRLRRICSLYGASPSFIFSSATISNPAQLAGELTDIEVDTVSENGAPQGQRHLVFFNPSGSPSQAAILLLKAALHRQLRTIVYTGSRKMAELIAIWAGQSGKFKDRISAYRSGFLPEERRDIEKKLFSGDLLAVISTSALELGIDIGDLDLCILVGYPGSIVATWQRGGRVGRSGQDSAVIMIAGEDALDQYFIHNPEDFFRREPEPAVINPYNPDILKRQIVCAAADLPLSVDEPFMLAAPVQKVVSTLEENGELLRSADGKRLYPGNASPYRFVDIRGSGSQFTIVCSNTGLNMGYIDGFRAFRETHPGAIYYHRGQTYFVDHLDTETMNVKVSAARVGYYTRVRDYKTTEILEILDENTVWGTRFFTGRLKVTDQVTGYERLNIQGGTKINIVQLDMPPLIFETEGLWFNISKEIEEEVISKSLHFMGGIHAIEHAAIGMFPLLVMADRNDLGGISTNFHPQLQSAAIFIYDAVPGGAGLSRQAFFRSNALLSYTLKVIKNCPCKFGCPSCVHSPKCGSGNRPISKEAAIFILQQIFAAQNTKNISTFKNSITDKNVYSTEKIRNADSIKENKSEFLHSKENKNKFLHSNRIVKNKPKNNYYFGVFDIETQRSAAEVGGWFNACMMGISCVVLYDSKKDAFLEFLEDQVQALIERLKQFDLVVGFNVKRFDYSVLNGYADFDFSKLPTLDILEEVHKSIGYRLSLDHLARVTLGAEKTADGLQALKWWKQGRISEIIDYCKADVALTRDLFIYGKKNGYILFNNKAGHTVRIPATW